MDRMKKHIRGCVCGLFFIGMSIQIVLGILWILANFAGFQEFGDSVRYVEISKSFLCDEYVGILYPVLIMFARAVQKLTRIPYYMALYGVQLTVACFAAWRFLRAWGAVVCGEKKPEGGGRATYLLFWNIWGTLCLATVPMAMQCHLAVLPESLTLSFFIVMMAYVLETSGKPLELQAVRLVKITSLWVVCTLLMPEYKYLAGLPAAALVLGSCLRLWREKRRQACYNAAILIIFLGIVMAITSLTQIPGSRGRMRRTPAAAAVSRFVWPNFQTNYGAWPEEIREIMDDYKAWETSRNADAVVNVFGPLVENAVGVKEAQGLYLRMARAAFTVRTKDILEKIAIDAVSYAVPPPALTLQLAGKGYDSYSGRNYEIMKDRAPGLTRAAVEYSGWWFCVGAALTGVSVLVRMAGKRRGREKGRRLLLGAAGLMVLYYTMSGAGMMDYKKTLFVTVLWYAWMLCEAIRREDHMTGGGE